MRYRCIHAPLFCIQEYSPISKYTVCMYKCVRTRVVLDTYSGSFHVRYTYSQTLFIRSSNLRAPQSTGRAFQNILTKFQNYCGELRIMATRKRCVITLENPERGEKVKRDH